ncbi:MAG: flavin reductase family protein [Clostridia bacterium]|nr:flavin reductase family protein [Clostridia bacterium]
MRKHFGARPWAYPMPVWVIASFDGDGRPDVMTAVRGGIIGDDRILICLDPVHRTFSNIRASRAFTVSMADTAHLAACDYAGLDSANDVPDKFDRTGFTFVPSKKVAAPVICELPMALECELVSSDPEEGIVVGRIVDVSAEESVLNEEGEIDAAKLSPVIYDPGAMVYRALGGPVGRAFYEGLGLRV